MQRKQQVQRHERAWHAQEQQAGWLVSTKQEEEDREEGVFQARTWFFILNAKGKVEWQCQGLEGGRNGKGPHLGLGFLSRVMKRF